MSDSVKEYYEASPAGLIWYLGKDHLSPSYDNSDDIALDSGMWREGASRRVLKMIQAMGVKPGERVLDFGSGIGGPGKDVQTATGCELYGLNLGLNQLLTARHLNPSFKNLVNADGQLLPFSDEAYEHVYSINMFYHIPKPDQAIAEIFRVLKPGGKLGLDDWFITDKVSPDNLDSLRYRWSSPQGFHNLASIKRFLTDSGFELLEEIDYTKEAGEFLTEERFGKTFDNQVKPILIEAFPKLYQYKGYEPEHAVQAALQLRNDILFMGDLYRDGEAVYKQLVAQKI